MLKYRLKLPHNNNSFLVTIITSYYYDNCLDNNTTIQQVKSVDANHQQIMIDHDRNYVKKTFDSTGATHSLTSFKIKQTINNFGQ